MNSNIKIENEKLKMIIDDIKDIISTRIQECSI